MTRAVTTAKTLPGFVGIVLMDNVSVPFANASIAYTSGKLGCQWSVDFPKPILVSGDSLWSIGYKFAGSTRYFIQSAKAESYTGDDTVKTSVTKISSQSLSLSENQDVLNNYGIPKTFCFINMEWLKQVSQGCAFIDSSTGAVMAYPINVGMIGQMGYPSLASCKAARFYHPRLPGKDHTADSTNQYDFHCYPASSHHNIARQLCQMIGVGFQCNTPDIPLLDTCTFSSGTKWFDCIKQNFTIWSPHISIVLDAASRPTVIVEDVFAQNINLDRQFQLVNIEATAVDSISRQLNRPSDDRLVEHVVIIGRKSQDTLTKFEERPDPNYTPIELPCIELEPTMTVMSEFKQDKMEGHKQMGSYEGSFGSGEDEWTVKPVRTTAKQLGFFEYKKGNVFKRIPVSEAVYNYDDDGNCNKVLTKHFYSPDYQKIVKTQEEHWFLTRMPGSKEKNMEKVRVKITLQNHVVKPLNLTLTSEMIEDKVLITKSVVDEGGSPKEVYNDPKALVEVLRANPNAIDTLPDTQQSVIEMTTYTKYTHIDRCSDTVLIKTDVATNYLAQNLPQINSQILDNPLKDAPPPSTTSKDNIFHREYKDPRSSGMYINGKGPFYHPARTIKHDDICTESVAYALALRVWIRKNLALSPTLWDLDLNVKVPVVLDFSATKIRLPDLTREISTAGGAYEAVTLYGGTYYLKRVQYNIKHSGTTREFSARLTIGDQL